MNYMTVEFVREKIKKLAMILNVKTPDESFINYIFQKFNNSTPYRFLKVCEYLSREECMKFPGYPKFKQTMFYVNQEENGKQNAKNTQNYQTTEPMATNEEWVIFAKKFNSLLESKSVDKFDPENFQCKNDHMRKAMIENEKKRLEKIKMQAQVKKMKKLRSEN